MATPVALTGDIQFKTSTRKHPADEHQTGRWVLVNSHVLYGQEMRVGDKRVALRATAAWSYEGGTSGSPPVAVSVRVDEFTLAARPTLLQDGGEDVLLDGDEETGSGDPGNQIVVVVTTSVIETDRPDPVVADEESA